jgi:hypothetical protein
MDNRGLEPSADFDQQLIADGVAKRVVDQLESIEIDQQECALAKFFRLPHDCFFEQFADQQAVGEPRQRIGSSRAHSIILTIARR